jgi:ribosomal protein L40E
MSDRDSIYISYRDYGEDDFNIKTMPYEKVEDTEELIEQAEAAVCETDEDRDRIDEYLVFLDNLLEHQSKFNEFKMAYEKLWTFDRTAALNAEYLAKKEAVTISYLGQRLFVYLTSDKLKALLPMKMDEDDEDDSAFYEDESVDATDDKAVDETLVAVSIENNAPLKIRYCRRCGAELFDDSVFCSKCGTRIAIELPPKETTEIPIITNATFSISR